MDEILPKIAQLKSKLNREEQEIKNFEKGAPMPAKKSGFFGIFSRIKNKEDSNADLRQLEMPELPPAKPPIPELKISSIAIKSLSSENKLPAMIKEHLESKNKISALKIKKEIMQKEEKEKPKKHEKIKISRKKNAFFEAEHFEEFRSRLADLKALTGEMEKIFARKAEEGKRQESDIMNVLKNAEEVKKSLGEIKTGILGKVK